APNQSVRQNHTSLGAPFHRKVPDICSCWLKVNQALGAAARNALGSSSDGLFAGSSNSRSFPCACLRQSSMIRNGVAITRWRASRPKFVIAAEKIMENSATNRSKKKTNGFSRQFFNTESSCWRRLHPNPAKKRPSKDA